MNHEALEQKSHFAMIGTIMIIVSFLFLLYMGSSMVSSTKRYMTQMQSIEMSSR